MQTIVYDRKLRQKVNPAFFYDIIYPLVRSVTTNDIGEKVETYTKGTGVRALVEPLQTSEEKNIEVDTVKMRKQNLYILCYNLDSIRDTNNRIEWNSKVLHITDEALTLERNKYVRIKAYITE